MIDYDMIGRAEEVGRVTCGMTHRTTSGGA